MALRSRPDRNSISNRYCAYCNFWEGDCGLKAHGPCDVEFDERAMGKCIKISNPRNAGYLACPKFEFSPNATRYMK